LKYENRLDLYDNSFSLMVAYFDSIYLTSRVK